MVGVSRVAGSSSQRTQLQSATRMHWASRSPMATSVQESLHLEERALIDMLRGYYRYPSLAV